MKTLPSIPSELIRLALADLEKAEASPEYKIEMSQWHYSQEVNEACQVCLAGAVMAFSLNCNIEETINPAHFDQKTQDKFYALNFFRVGEVRAGLQHLDVSFLKRHKWPKEKRHICPYLFDKVRFKADMRQLANDLEKVGL